MKNPNLNPIPSDLKSLISAPRTRRTKLVAYGFVFAFVAFTAFLAFNPSNNASSPWFYNLFSSSSTSSLKASLAPYRSQVSSLFSHFFPNSSSSMSNVVDGGDGSSKDSILGHGSLQDGPSVKNQTQAANLGADSERNGAKNESVGVIGSKENGVLASKNQTEGGIDTTKNQTASSEVSANVQKEPKPNNSTKNGQKEANAPSNTQKEPKDDDSTQNGQKEANVSSNTQKESNPDNNSTQNGGKEIEKGTKVANLTGALVKGNNSAESVSNGNGKEKKREKWIEDMIGCDIFRGHWVKDESYPLYPEGSCPHIDEPFDCFLNGRPDRSYQKLRWQPIGCNIPRLNATDMLERLRGKRLVFVGDSLNRNMWESLICILKNSVKDRSKVFEASGRHEFRTQGSYSFLFKDYNSTVEFFRSPFLVQEWEMPAGNGTKETLRLDIIERSSSKYKDAHVIIFNTGHWWTHEKTAKGKDYYQEGNRVYSELNVVEAFHKALNTWAKWVDANVNPKKSLVFFRGYSASHFSGGQWNSGGACDKETEPITNDKYLSSYPPKMNVLESVLRQMKTPVSYLNITRMTDYRKDAHPSVFRKQKLTEEERRDPLRFQDCSHWCLPGVPDSWNELLYAELIIKQYLMAQ